MEATKRKQSYMGDNSNSREVLLTDKVYPRLLITFGGADAVRPQVEIDVEEFIAVKGYKAKGKRLTTWQVENIEELEPLRFPESSEDSENFEDSENSEDSEAPETPEPPVDSEDSSSDAPIELSLFPNE